MAAPVFDHLILGIDDLDQGIEWLRYRTGVTAIKGGSHPGAGTRNALLSLGKRQYLEIMSIDPAQKDSSLLAGLIRQIQRPELIRWAAPSSDIQSLADKARTMGFDFEGPNEGSRLTPGGRRLQWKTLRFHEDYGGVLPFFIEWSTDVHPSEDSPEGCRIKTFEIHHPEPDRVRQALRQLGLAAKVLIGAKPYLNAVLSAPDGSAVHLPGRS